MPLASGSRLGPYEISSPLGAGGMGEVYRARDTRLERTVAIKVLPMHLAARADVRQRFEREAKAISALNHPHICVLHDVGHQDGVDFLVMEHLEGETLAERLKKGPLPLEQVLRYGIEIADALDGAHRQGIVHRDLKPGNVMLTKTGAKLLDFGLAKLRVEAHPAGSLEVTALGTEERSLTAEGTIIGTLHYMAPEQLEGAEPDARSDIFALGAVLYEMVTGERAFAGKSQPSVIAAILATHPSSISQVQPLTPPGLDHIVATCLAKDPDDRWQSARDLTNQLRWIAQTGSQARLPGPAPARRRSRERMAWAAAVAAAVLLGSALGFAMARRGVRPGKPFPVRFQVFPPEKTTSILRGMALSPDGQRLAFFAAGEGDSGLYVRPLDSTTATRIPGTEGAFQPFWSPDGQQIGFVSQRQLRKVDLSGGTPQTLCDLRVYFSGASWSQEGIIFSDGGELFRVPAGGGAPQPLGKRAEGETARHFPQFLPDGRRYLYFSQAASPEKQGIYVASVDTDDRKRIVASDHNAAYLPPGHLLFTKDGALMAQGFDLKSLELSGEAFPVVEQVAIVATFPGAAYSVSLNGALAWQAGSGLASTQLTWFDRSGKKLGTLGEPADYSNPALSPDERILAVGRRDPQRKTRDLWVLDLVRGTSTRLTFDPGDDFNPTWSPDGARIAFTSSRRGVREIYQKLADGSGDDELLVESKDWAKHVEDWSADGRFLLYNYNQGGSTTDLFLLPLPPGADRKRGPFLATEFAETMGQFAPSGRRLAYCSDESGRAEVYVRSVSPDGASGTGKWQISTAGGLEPRWRRDGKELFYLSESTLMAVDVADGASFEAGTPRPLFKVPLPGPLRNRYVVTRDGQRFLFNALVEQTTDPIHVLVSWQAAKR